jgi:hypothetical protein
VIKTFDIVNVTGGTECYNELEIVESYGGVRL